MSRMTEFRKLDVVFAAVPMLGHMAPLLPYAEELLARGHSVTFVHASHPKYRRKLEGCGLSACQSVTYHDGDGPEVVGGRNMFDSIVEHYSTEASHTAAPARPSIVVYEFFAVDAADAADKLGVPAVAVFPNLAVSINPWPASARTQERSWLWALWCKALLPGLEGTLARMLWLNRARTRRSRGLPLLEEQDLYPGPFQRRPMIGCTAPELEVNTEQLLQSGLFRMVGPALTAAAETVDKDLEDWLQIQQQESKIVVYVAFGTMYRYSRSSVQKMQSELQKFGTRVAVLWSLPEKAQIEFLDAQTVPAHWRVAPFVPQMALLRSGRVGAFVTHCGSNSVFEALLSGVPMVAYPGSADQPANALRLSRVGVAVVARNGVAAALQDVLDNLDCMRQAAVNLAKAVKSHGGAEKAVSLIESIAQSENSAWPILTGEEAVVRRTRMPWWPAPLILLATIPVVVWGVRFAWSQS